jgi:hypothetical protein
MPGCDSLVRSFSFLLRLLLICAVLNEYKEDLSIRKKNSIFLVVSCFFCGSECFTAEGVRAIVEEKRPSRPGKTLIILSLSGEVDGRSTSSMPKGCGHTKHICLYYLFIFYALRGAYIHIDVSTNKV